MDEKEKEELDTSAENEEGYEISAEKEELYTSTEEDQPSIVKRESLAQVFEEAEPKQVSSLLDTNTDATLESS